ncbi:hypothetical protein GW915_01260 [bacterium]|nr:hypothetical protein [bacterium]
MISLNCLRCAHLALFAILTSGPSFALPCDDFLEEVFEPIKPESYQEIFSQLVTPVSDEQFSTLMARLSASTATPSQGLSYSDAELTTETEKFVKILIEEDVPQMAPLDHIQWSIAKARYSLPDGVLSGSEHIVFPNKEQKYVLKVSTKKIVYKKEAYEGFGLTLRFQPTEDGYKIVLARASPQQYLKRIQLVQEHFNTDWKLVGFSYSEEGGVSLITRQEYFQTNRETRHALFDEIEPDMIRRGFIPIQYTEDYPNYWYHPQKHLLVGDIRAGNVILFHRSGTESVFNYIDPLVVEIPPGPQRSFLLTKINEVRN